MRKLILAGTLMAAAVGLAACGYDEQEYNQANADYSADEANYVDNGTDYNNVGDNYANEVGNMDNGVDTNEADNTATNTGY